MMLDQFDLKPIGHNTISQTPKYKNSKNMLYTESTPDWKSKIV